MNARKMLLTLICLAIVCAIPASAGEKAGAREEAGAGMSAEMQKMMEMMQKLGSPGPEHEHLKKAVGKWTTSTQMWMGGPGAPPTTTTGSVECRSILGGRYVVQEYKGTFMDRPFEGMGIDGYDNFRHQYVSTWIDSVGTAMMSMRGSCTPDGKTCTYFGEMDEPTTGEVGKTVRTVVRWLDPDKFTFEMYDNAMGGEWKVMEITYSRAK